MKLALVLPVVLASVVAAAAQMPPNSNPLGSIAIEKVDRVVVPNVDTVIDYAYFLNADCSSAGTVQHRILKKPMHGEIVLAEGDQYPGYESPNVRAGCNGQKARAAEVHYKAADGFNGTDSADIVTIYPDGTAHRHVYAIIVG